jgi:GcrA cell cycle regulator
MGWTNESTETVKNLWLDGLSASQIARQIGGVTRNAVTRKIHRLGLTGRIIPSAPVLSAPARTRAPSVPRVVKAKPKPAIADFPEPQVPVVFEAIQEPPQLPCLPLVEHVEDRGGATILTLGRHMCKWPIGHPSSEDFTFCGRKNDGKRPYCLEHNALAFAPQQGKPIARGNELARSLRRYI